MRSLRAGIYKDIRLFLTASGILSLILPVLVAAALMLGLNDAQSADTNIQPFEIAVYDMDDTLMSRTLVGQLRNVELISKVRHYTEKSISENEKSLLDENGDLKAGNGLFDAPVFKDCAVVMILPLDFFYDAYTGEEEPVRIVLNGDMPLESALASSMASSVSGILKSERAAWYAAYSVKAGGEFDRADFERFCENSAETILDNALGRLNVFKNPDIRAELSASVKNPFFACAASMLMLFVSLGVLKTLPEERRLGLYDRFVSAGGSLFQLILSKFITAAVFCAIGILPLYFILKPDMHGGVFVLAAAFIACFLLMLMQARLTRSAESYLIIGGILTAAELLFGGVIYPAKLFPLFAKRISVLTVPKYLIAGLEKSEISASVIPLAVIAAACLAVFIVLEAALRGIRRSKRGRRKV